MFNKNKVPETKFFTKLKKIEPSIFGPFPFFQVGSFNISQLTKVESYRTWQNRKIS